MSNFRCYFFVLLTLVAACSEEKPIHNGNMFSSKYCDVSQSDGDAFFIDFPKGIYSLGDLSIQQNHFNDGRLFGITGQVPFIFPLDKELGKSFNARLGNNYLISVKESLLGVEEIEIIHADTRYRPGFASEKIILKLSQGRNLIAFDIYSFEGKGVEITSYEICAGSPVNFQPN